jgi:uncharacterized protein (TIGR03083 family)
MAHLRRDAPALEELLRAVDLTAAVPGCPGWTVADLAHHLGAIHRWATAILASGVVQDEPTPDGDPLEWYAQGWPPLLEALAAADVTAPCWGLGPPPRVAGFWQRRMAHETAMHLLDVHRAAGSPPTMPADLAADGVAEVTEVFVPRQLRLGRCPPLPYAVSLVAAEGRWQLGEGLPATTVAGSPLELLLVVWRRELGRATITGQAIEPVLALPLTP